MDARIAPPRRPEWGYQGDDCRDLVERDPRRGRALALAILDHAEAHVPHYEEREPDGPARWAKLCSDLRRLLEADPTAVWAVLQDAIAKVPRDERAAVLARSLADD